MADSFIKRAPELAEEILAKTASLPKDLASFSRALLTKEAVVETERLELPKRMSLGELRKLAFEKQVDLPKIASVSTDEHEKISQDLQAMAKRAQDDEAMDVLATGAAIAAHRKTAAGGLALGAAGAKFQHPLKRLVSRGARAEHELAEAAHAKRLSGIKSETPGTVEFAEAAAAKAPGEKARARAEFGSEALKAAPAIGLGVGAPLAAAALLSGKGRDKKEEVKIYK